MRRRLKRLQTKACGQLLRSSTSIQSLFPFSPHFLYTLRVTVMTLGPTVERSTSETTEHRHWGLYMKTY